MRFLLHGKSLTPSVAEALTRHAHTPVSLAEAQLPDQADAAQVLEAARARQLDVITTDANLVEHIYQADLWFARVMVYLQLPGQDVEQDDAIDRLFTRYKRLTPGRLYTVTETRVKVRQLPSKGVKRGGGDALFRDSDEAE